MDRLTYYENEDKGFPMLKECRHCSPGDNNEKCGLCEHNDTGLAMLASYEDIGYSPSRLAAIINEFTELTKWFKNIKKSYCDLAIRNHDGSCQGLAKSEEDDEPPEMCKVCSKHYINIDEMERANHG